MQKNVPARGGGGVLFVVATPIGNLEDASPRALRVLREADAVFAEDTRHTMKLLAAHGIRVPLVSCHEHNEAERVARLLDLLAEGKSAALVTDAGTPAISDPGYRMAAAACDAGFSVTPVPGPCAFVAALCASGLPTDSHYFAGFLPRKAGRRREKIEEIARLSATLVFYESPRRAGALARELLQILGDRRAVLARELTKIHEEFLRGSLSEIAAEIERRGDLKGEVTLLVAGRGGGAEEPGPGGWELALKEGLAAGRLPLARLAEDVAARFGLARREVYARALALKDEAGEDGEAP